MKPILGWTFAIAAALLLITGAVPGTLFFGWLAWLLLKKPSEASTQSASAVPPRHERLDDRRKRLATRLAASATTVDQLLDVTESPTDVLSTFPLRSRTTAPNRPIGAPLRRTPSGGDVVDALTHYLDD